MGFWKRVWSLLAGKGFKLLDKAENPDETLDYSYEQQLVLLQNVKRGIADLVTAKKRVEFQLVAAQGSAAKLDSQARQALSAGKDDLARAALERKAVAENQLLQLHEQVGELEDQQSQLISKERTLSLQINKFKTDKEVIKARYSAAEASVKIGESISGITDTAMNAGAAIARVKDKTDQMEARAAAIGELGDTDVFADFTGEDSITRELEQIASSGKVDKELEAMRKELNP